MTVPGQVACFRIYPEPGLSRLYYRVRIFATVAQMHAYVRTRRACPSRPGRYTKGICSSYTVQRRQGGRWRSTPELGEIVYAKRFLGARVLSHECTHAMFGWARRRRIDVTETGHGAVIVGGEERACGALGDMMRQLSIEVWDRGLAR